LATVIDGRCIGIERSVKIERCVSGVAVQKAMIDAIAVYVSSDNLPSFVNA
jgi:hypothetical protein